MWGRIPFLGPGRRCSRRPGGSDPGPVVEAEVGVVDGGWVAYVTRPDMDRVVGSVGGEREAVGAA